MNTAGQSQGRSLKGYRLTGLAVVTCPCHLVIPLSLLSGTVAGAFLSEYLVAAFLLLLLVFILSSVGALRTLGRGRIETDNSPYERSGANLSRTCKKETGCPD